ncbi:hypothetical protein GCM10011363_14160 [Marivita lacus]|uniref:DUF4276 family protein n=1 Tax=Marivita lacus TaxID=1323742 RepID=A0ABQ1KKE3_9RHOB|nr:hypothetical protein [Marivita lacus]GGB98679.1 hypothetical protein GCM10011363_14160 [Marivita lacus]
MTVFYCIEDEVSRSVAERLILEFCPSGTHFQELGKAYGGYGYIKANLRKFVDLSQRSPVLVITDLDRAACAPSLRSEWLQSAGLHKALPKGFVFCVAKTEIESWLMADVNGIARLLEISAALISRDIEDIVLDAKEHLVGLAKKSRSASVRKDYTPGSKSKATTGINYNYLLSNFAANDWNPLEAADNSVSLRRAIDRLSAATAV